jgi:hypothetical protein
MLRESLAARYSMRTRSPGQRLQIDRDSCGSDVCSLGGGNAEPNQQGGHLFWQARFRVCLFQKKKPGSALFQRGNSDKEVRSEDCCRASNQAWEESSNIGAYSRGLSATSAVRVILFQDNASVSSSRRCACFDSSMI